MTEMTRTLALHWAGIIVLVLVYFYLHAQYREPALRVWGWSWCVYSLRILFEILELGWHHSAWFAFGYHAAVIWSGWLLLRGTYLFSQRPMPRWWLPVAGLLTLWVGVGIEQQVALLPLTLPVFAAIGAVYLWTGLVFFRLPPAYGAWRYLLGSAFLLWGAHKLDYPFVRHIEWFAPWGYLIAAVIQQLVAVGLLGVYFHWARETLERSETRYRHLLANSPDIIARLDAGGVITYISPSIENLLKAPAAAFIDRGYGELLSPESLPGFNIALRQARQGETAAGVEVTLAAAPSPVFEASIASDQENADAAFTLILRDISERKRSEEILRRNELQYRSIIETAYEGVWVIDAAGKTVSVNERMAHLLGYSVEEMMGQSLFDFMAPASRDTAMQHFWGERLRVKKKLDIRFESKDGSELWTIVALNPHFDETGTPIGALGMVTDITERKWAEIRLHRLNRTLAVLSACTHTLIHADNEEHLLFSFCRNIIEQGCHRLAWVGLAERGEQTVLVPRAWAGFEEGYLEEQDFGWHEAEPFKTPETAAFRSARPVVIPDTGKEQRFAVWQRSIVQRGYGSSIALPLIRNTQPFGVLAIFAEEPDTFDQEESGLLTELADDLVFGLINLWNTTARQRAEQCLWLRQRAIDASLNGILITDAQNPAHPIIYANPAFKRTSGFSDEELLGASFPHLRDQAAASPAMAKIETALQQQRAESVVSRSFRADGTPYWCEIHLAPVPDEERRVSHFIWFVNDITEHKNYEEQLERQANYDPVTGLPNRNLLYNRLQQALDNAGRYQREGAVFFLDLDYFKIVNDSLGHEVGDRVITTLGERLSGCARQSDTVARYGGDMFVFVLPELLQQEDAAVVLDRIFEAINRPCQVGDHELRLTCSIGVALFPRDGSDVHTLIRNADTAMHRAKETGRNAFRYYTEELNVRALERLSIEGRLRAALERDELVLYYQPQIELATGRIIGMEALVRWQHPEMGTVSPGRFIPIAEETGLIVPIGRWVLHAACAQLKAWLDKGLPTVPVALNLSAKQLYHSDIVKTAAEALEAAGLEGSSLVLEITESSLLEQPEKIATLLHALKGLGITTSIDDFGTGYSNLAYLKRYPFDELKIDQTFIRDVINDPDDAAIALTIITMAHTLNYRVIAEGVETEAQLNFLCRHRCDRMQGYLFSPPVPAPQMEALLHDRRRLAIAQSPLPSGDRTLLIIGEPRQGDLLVDALEQDGYQRLTAYTAQQGYEILAGRQVAVVIAALEVGGMDGIHFLEGVKNLYPDTVRLAMAPASALAAVGEAINRGILYKCIVLPAAAETLRQSVREAFHRRDLIRENLRLRATADREAGPLSCGA